MCASQGKLRLFSSLQIIIFIAHSSVFTQSCYIGAITTWTIEYSRCLFSFPICPFAPLHPSSDIGILHDFTPSWTCLCIEAKSLRARQKELRDWGCCWPESGIRLHLAAALLLNTATQSHRWGLSSVMQTLACGIVWSCFQISSSHHIPGPEMPDVLQKYLAKGSDNGLIEK